MSVSSISLGPGPVIIAGLGDEALSDDGVGVHAVRVLRDDPPPGAIPVEMGTSAVLSMHLLEDAGLVIALDAMQGGCSPGTIYSITGDDLARGLVQSMHEHGLLRAMRRLRRIVPPRILLLGVEPGCLAHGLELTPAVRDAVPRLVGLVRKQVAAL